MCLLILTSMYIVEDLEERRVIGYPIKTLEEARTRARACRKAGLKVIIRKIQ